MKKFLGLCILLLVVFSLSITASAKKEDLKEFGISFELPDNFEEVLKDNQTIMYSFFKDGRTALTINAVPDTDAYFEGSFSDEFFRIFLEDLYEDENIGNALSSVNKMNITATSVSKDFHPYLVNGINYYALDAQYILSASGMQSEKYYTNVLICAKNGKIYIYMFEYFNENPAPKAFESFISSVSYDLGELKILMNGEKLVSDTPPAAINNRILIPIRPVAEKMGYEVEWKQEENLVVIHSNKKEIIFELGNDIYFINGEEHILDVAAIAYSGRTYIPLRAAAEAMGAAVEWDSTQNSAKLSY